MGRCINHPERDTSYMCMKYKVYLCEECLVCRDPKIYCTFRSSCPIWFMEKRRKSWEEETREQAAQEQYTVTFEPSGKTANVAEGTTLLEAASAADVYVNASCSGKGACGKCRLVVTSGPTEAPATPFLTRDELARGYVLACQARVKGNVTARIPDEALARKLRVAGTGGEATLKLKGLVPDIEPMLMELTLTLEPPTLDDAVSDLDRLNRGLKKMGCDVARMNVGLPVMRQLAETVRREDWKIEVDVIRRKCANEILAIRPGHTGRRPLGAAIDIGTTTIVVYLVDMADGAVLAAASGHNRQAACGDDVINRIVCAEKDGVKKLSSMALATINSLIGEALDSIAAGIRDLRNIVLSGNTTMIHLLLQIEPRYIRRTPYIPCITEFPIMKAGEIGLRADPTAAVFIMPGPAGYVGGDIVAGVLYAGFHREGPLTLFIDVGTNGEIVLGNRDWLMTAACSAGPAFEGGGIRWGMRAEDGAIERVTIDGGTLEPSLGTVGDAPPRGICGSGMIDLISELLSSGIIDRGGKYTDARQHPRLQPVEGEPAYVLAFAKDTEIQEDIVFTQSDLKNLIYSKAAVYAGFSTLLAQAGLDFDQVERMIITGGFGQYLNIGKSIAIGLLPDMAPEKFTYLGNSSIAGAYLALLSDSHRREASILCNNMTYIDFSSNPSYMSDFTSALFLPHTDLDRFPSVTASAGS